MNIEDLLKERITKRELNKNQLMEFIPHRDEMLQLDAIFDYEPGEWAIGCKRIHPENIFLKGHFPGYPIFPGSMQIEALSQVCVLVMLTSIGDEYNAGLLAEVKNARFFKPVLPTYEMVFYAVKKWDRMGIWHFTGMARCGNQTVMSADMTLTLKYIN